MPTLLQTRRARHLAGALALALDAGYLAAWWFAPVPAWSAWIVAAGLALGTWCAVARMWRPGHGAAPAYLLALVAPASATWRTVRSSPAARGHRFHADRGLALFLAAIVALCATGTLERRVATPILAPVDTSADHYVDRALLQAGGAYLGTRVLDRLLAVAADIQIDLFVVQGRPGQIFDPLRDLLDRFSTVILVAVASLTLQKVALGLGVDLGITLFLAGACALLVAALAWPGRGLRDALARAAAVLLGAAVLMRLLLPLTGIGVEALAERTLDERRQVALTAVENAAGDVGIELQLRERDGAGTVQGEPLPQAVDDLQASARQLRQVDTGWLESLFDAFLSLTAVFVIETLIAPLLLLGLLWLLARRLLQAPRSGVPDRPH